MKRTGTAAKARQARSWARMRSSGPPSPARPKRRRAHRSFVFVHRLYQKARRAEERYGGARRASVPRSALPENENLSLLAAFDRRVQRRFDRLLKAAGICVEGLA